MSDSMAVQAGKLEYHNERLVELVDVLATSALNCIVVFKKNNPQYDGDYDLDSAEDKLRELLSEKEKHTWKEDD